MLNREESVLRFKQCNRLHRNISGSKVHPKVRRKEKSPLDTNMKTTKAITAKPAQILPNAVILQYFTF